MLSTQNPTETQAWKKLEAHFTQMRECQMKDLFAEDAARFDAFSTKFEDILIDYSKNIITTETLDLLRELAEEMQVQNAIQQMFEGEKSIKRKIVRCCTSLCAIARIMRFI